MRTVAATAAVRLPLSRTRPAPAPAGLSSQALSRTLLPAEALTKGRGGRYTVGGLP